MTQAAPEPAAIESIAGYLQALQGRICEALAAADGAAGFGDDRWDEGDEGSRGRTRVLAGGAVFERAGVGYSDLRGTLPGGPGGRRPELAGRPYRALGVSVVTHPANPYVPISHANVRLFVVGGGGGAQPPAGAGSDDAPPAGDRRWWFGGGFDLTPCYGFAADAVHWHETARSALAPFGDELYERYKGWCDEYFQLPHRGEQRGVGGLFFDDLTAGGFERCAALARSVGDHYLPAYLPLVERRRSTPFGERQRAFQLYRRGRYAEFNLLYDRGTRFGVLSGGRAESILMSLPPLAAWRYAWRPEPGSPEESLVGDFLRPRDWLEG